MSSAFVACASGKTVWYSSMLSSSSSSRYNAKQAVVPSLFLFFDVLTHQVTLFLF
jgi:hypothetical protein